MRGVIFFSGSSSSAKFFLYFSQFAPVALGMVMGEDVARRQGEKEEGIESEKGYRFVRSKKGITQALQRQHRAMGGDGA